ncbi:DMT family transporter [Rhodospirillum centenum]|uniref:Membrane protein, putative n=1 Tax=Rhodospirillum centenum (strain ATCC 51521 / SW) TaxID=414684 RepID=B6IYB9_RHOCS|nr:EamA family transporter [Rhodospirillum centenum]ACJ01293.1 membrane protein, putative [Rhodospirillum centenum SW]
MSSPAAVLSPAAPAIRRATLIGATAVLLWATLATLTSFAGPVPPFQMVAMSFGIGGITGLLVQIVRRRPLSQALFQPLPVWLLGVGGLFGYHFFYFIAMRTAPAVEANLINYLWPLFIVLFSGLLPGERLGRAALAGAAAGLAGTLLLVGGGAEAGEMGGGHWAGYLSALACALIWSAYSVAMRRHGEVPTEAVTGFCLGTSVLAALCHLLFEVTVWPQGAAWLVVLAMGLGPLGIAFFVWDYGIKRGDIQTLGALSYAAPLLSTALLIALGRGEPTPTLGLACLLIVGGAVIAGRGLARG